MHETHTIPTNYGLDTENNHAHINLYNIALISTRKFSL